MEIMRKHALRITTNANNPSNISLLDHGANYTSRNMPTSVYKILQPIEHELQLINKNIKMDRSQLPPWKSREINIDLHTSTLVDKRTQTETVRNRVICTYLEKYAGYCHYYTDAVKIHNAVACAVVTDGVEAAYRLPDETDVDDAELYAILQAIEMINININNLSNKAFLICTDSQRALKSIDSYTDKNSNDIIKDLIKSYISVTHSGASITLVWVPAHLGITGNCKADRAAKCALNISRTHIKNLPITTNKNKIAIV
jgi:ribonuclease HI